MPTPDTQHYLHAREAGALIRKAKPGSGFFLLAPTSAYDPVTNERHASMYNLYLNISRSDMLRLLRDWNDKRGHVEITVVTTGRKSSYWIGG